MSGKKKQSEQQKELRDLDLPLNFDVTSSTSSSRQRRSRRTPRSSRRGAAAGQAKS